MFIKSSFVVFLILSFCSYLYAASNDLCITYEVPQGIKQKFFKEIVEQAVPGKTAPDRYHVTLMMVEDIKPNLLHCNALRDRLQAIRNSTLPQAHFTPVSATEIQPGKAIVMEPTHAESAQFKIVNNLIYSEVMKFNLQNNTAYKVKQFLEPNNYNPHLTIAMPAHLQAYGLNSQNVIQSVNVKLANYKNVYGVDLDLMQAVQPQPATPPQPPIPQSIAAPVPAPAPKQQKASLVKKKLASKITSIRHAIRKAVLIRKPTHRATRKATLISKPTPQVNRRSASKIRQVRYVNKRTAIKRSRKIAHRRRK